MESKKKDDYPEFETIDPENNVIVLRKYDWEHICERRGNEWHNYWEFIKDTIENPDFIGKSGTNNESKVYIQKRSNARRRFISKFLIVIVNNNNNVATTYFSKKISKFKEIKTIK